MPRLSFTLPLLLVSLAASAQPRETRVQITIPPETLSGLSSAQLVTANAVKAHLEEHFTKYQDLALDLPPSAFADGAEVVRFRDLLKVDQDDEVPRLGGEDKPLNAEQLASVREEGMFKVPSQRYPGRHHVWKYSIFLQQGLKTIRMTWDARRTRALDELRIAIPATLFADDGSLAQALRLVHASILELYDFEFGLTDLKRTYDTGEAWRLIAEQRTLARGAPRFGDDLFRDRVQHQLAQVRARAEQLWSTKLGDALARAKTSLRGQNLSPEDFDTRVEALVRREKQEALYAAILASPEIEAERPGLGDQLVRQGRALEVIQDAEARFDLDVTAFAIAALDRERAAHPFRTASEGWRTQILNRYAAEYRAQNLWPHYALVADELHRANLPEEEKELRAEIEFFSTNQTRFKQLYLEATEPARSFTFNEPIFRKANWGIATSLNGSHSIKRDRNYTVDTGTFGWRLDALKRRTRTYFLSGIYALVFDNLWHGSLGLKALVLKDPFPRYWRVVQEGEPGVAKTIVPGGHQRVMTLRRMIRGRFERADRIIADFDLKDDFAFGGFSKRLLYAANIVHANLYRTLGTAGLVVDRVVGTAMNTAFTTAAVATAAAWAPTAAVLRNLFDANVIDTQAPGVRNQPTLLGAPRATLRGAFYSLTVPVLLVKAILYHPLAALTRAGSGVFVYHVTKAWDALWFKLIERDAKVPVRNSLFAHRIQGPGLDANYFFTLKPSLVLTALLADLERRELDARAEDLRRVIAKPSVEAQDMLRAYAAVLGPIDSQRSPALREVRGERERWMTKLEEKLKARQEQVLNRLRIPDEAKDRVRLENDAFAEVEAKGRLLVKAAFAKIFDKMEDAGRREFFTRQNLAFNDWTGLTHVILADVFGPMILRRLDPADDQFKIVVHDADLETALDGLLRGELPAGVELRDLRPLPLPRMEYAENPQLRITDAKLCAELLIQPL